jgi:outer membrane lipoprotein carrier protein
MLETGMATDTDGTVAYMKPERLRIERSKPERQTIVLDGKDLWVYLPLRPQAIQLSMEDLKNSDPLASSLLQFGSYAKMLKTYDVALDSAAGRPQLVLRPKERTVDFTLRFQLDPATLFPARTELAVQGMRIDSTFSDYRFNPRVDESLFKFSPPAGTEVIRNLKPPRMSP